MTASGIPRDIVVMKKVDELSKSFKTLRDEGKAEFAIIRVKVPENICNILRTRMEITGVVAVTAADIEAVRADIVESMAAMQRSLQSNIQNIAEEQNDMLKSVNATKLCQCN